MTYKIEWHGEYPELTADQSTKLAGELAYLSKELEQPGNLIFHTVWLTEDQDGPSVMIYGRPDYPDTFFMTYYEETKWVTLEQDEDEMEN